MWLFNVKSCVDSCGNNNNVTQLPVGPAGADGKDGGFASAPKNYVGMYHGTVAEFNLDFPAGTGVGKYDGWIWLNGAGGQPDSRGMTPVGYSDTDADYSNFSNTVGAKKITITEANLPAHTHVVNDAGHTHDKTIGQHSHDIQFNPREYTVDVSAHGHTGTTGNSVPPTHNHIHDDYGTDVGSFQIGGNSIAAGTDEGIWREPNGSLNQTGQGGLHQHNFSTSQEIVTIGVSDNGISATILNNSDYDVDILPATTNITIGSTGSGTQIDVRQPSMVFAYIKKITDPS